MLTASSAFSSRQIFPSKGRRNHCFFTNFIPDIFSWVALRRIGRQEQQQNVVGQRKVAAAMVGGAIENQKDILPGKFFGRGH
jgi:hypothetical protein